jgi:hypothetical protein
LTLGELAEEALEAMDFDVRGRVIECADTSLSGHAMRRVLENGLRRPWGRFVAHDGSQFETTERKFRYGVI